MSVVLCCGSQPIAQVRKGRRVHFCLRCGESYDEGGESVRERMRDQLHRLAHEGEIREPALMIGGTHDSVLRIKRGR